MPFDDIYLAAGVLVFLAGSFSIMSMAKSRGGLGTALSMILLIVFSAIIAFMPLLMETFAG